MKFSEVKPGTLILVNNTRFYIVIGSETVVVSEQNNVKIHYIEDDGSIDYYVGLLDEEFVLQNEVVICE